MTTRRQLRYFFILSYLICCVFWIPLFLSTFNIILIDDPNIFFILGAFGPMIAALIIAYKVEGFFGCTGLLKKLCKIRMHYQWYLFAFFIPVVIALFVLISLLFISKWEIEINFMDPFEYLGAFFISLLIVPGEEIGWRGFALPRLQKSYSALTSSIILGFFWSLIHFPLFFVQPERQAGVNIFIVIPGFIILMILFSIIITFLYNESGGSILIPCIFHASLGAANHLYKSPSHEYDLTAMYLFLVITLFITLFLVNKVGYKNLSLTGKIIYNSTN